MATPTDSELLDAAKTCLADVLANGQHFASNGRVYTKADLHEVRETIRWLEDCVRARARSSSGGIFDRARFATPYRG